MADNRPRSAFVCTRHISDGASGADAVQSVIVFARDTESALAIVAEELEMHRRFAPTTPAFASSPQFDTFEIFLDSAKVIAFFTSQSVALARPAE